ncbi:hypothetical protein CEQ03_07875 [Stenotrophomonas maltophilia]|nr:hypothetical protein CEQ03_07875 [Stenotrophomonas maltophilia]
MKRFSLGHRRLGRRPDSPPISEQLVQRSQILSDLHTFLGCGGGSCLDAGPVVNKVDWVSTCSLAQHLGGDLQGHSYII